MNPNWDRMIAAAVATLTSFAVATAAALVKLIGHITGAQINDGLINVVVGVVLTAAVAGVAFIINHLLESRGWQEGLDEWKRGVDERLKHMETELKKRNDDRD